LIKQIPSRLCCKREAYAIFVYTHLTTIAISDVWLDCCYVSWFLVGACVVASGLGLVAARVRVINVIMNASLNNHGRFPASDLEIYIKNGHE
jgi:hypothetical protein